MGDDRTRRRDGYTLVELLVVLTIIAFAAALVLPRLIPDSDAAAVRRTTSLLDMAARSARTDARLQGRDAVLVVDLDARTAEIEPSGRRYELPARVTLTATVAETELEGARAGVRFFPDGGATGGRFDITAGRAAGALRIDWITGRVRHGADPEE